MEESNGEHTAAQVEHKYNRHSTLSAAYSAIHRFECESIKKFLSYSMYTATSVVQSCVGSSFNSIPP